ncbi:MAG: STAS domain-containing protein [Rhodocyclaceae bacterium]|nr:STAS domain-containing protein [Rhodocyclaceae bacterium]
MQANVVNAEGRAVIRLQGRFDFNAHREFRGAVDEAMKGDVREVVVDLAGVDYLDSSALGMLLMLRDKTRSVNKAVTLTGSHGAVKQVLDIANFNKLFAIG